jgi:hypothetical protein
MSGLSHPEAQVRRCSMRRTAMGKRHPAGQHLCLAPENREEFIQDAARRERGVAIGQFRISVKWNALPISNIGVELETIMNVSSKDGRSACWNPSRVSRLPDVSLFAADVERASACRSLRSAGNSRSTQPKVSYSRVRSIGGEDRGSRSGDRCRHQRRDEQCSASSAKGSRGASSS